MRHLIVSNYGVFLGLKSARIVVKKDGQTLKEIALNRVKSIHILSNGISLSSDLVNACGVRGIKIFFNASNSFMALHTLYEHKSVAIRQNQILSCENLKGLQLAKELIVGKLKNQRATLLYSSRSFDNLAKKKVIEFFDSSIAKLKNRQNISKEFILGIEGSCANYYFLYLKEMNLLPSSFESRYKRGATDITNIALNYGYAILFNFIYKACVNAGLEPYMGVLHSIRSAKPSLVLDIMEEYRSFVVDRNVIKNRFKLQKAKSFDSVKRDIVSSVLSTLGKKYKYNHRRLSLESIIQRQVYRISGYFCDEKRYKSYVFRW